MQSSTSSRVLIVCTSLMLKSVERTPTSVLTFCHIRASLRSMQRVLNYGSSLPEARAALEKQYMLGKTIRVPDARDQLEGLLRVELAVGSDPGLHVAACNTTCHL
eukprot:726935-Amphidinium_carterae.1